ncbi:MAG: TetR family transcriptional regulator [Betaproteobacteria bacterium]|nr:TetR family transcriptional regulator [Betaproteobacteria bacterium]
MTTPQVRKTRGRPRTLDRSRTVDVAMDSYWREGVHALGLNEICRRTGISKPVLYREFGGEDGLMAEALDRYREEVGMTLFNLLAADRPFPEVLEEIVRWFTEDRGRPVGCLFARMRSSPSRLGPVTTKRVAALRDEMRAAYEAWYERGRSRNEVNPAIPSKLAAMFIDTQLTCVLLQMTLGESPDAVRAQAGLALQSLLPNASG